VEPDIEPPQKIELGIVEADAAEADSEVKNLRRFVNFIWMRS